MTGRTDTGQTLAWSREGMQAVLSAVAALPDAGLREPSRLPGWSRAHVLAHLARNADALVNLLIWARTGVETPMYASRARDSDIATGAALPPGRLRVELELSEAGFQAASEQLPSVGWAAVVRTGQGRQVTADQVPWLRAREAWLHLVDLGVGVETTEFPPLLVDELLAEVTASFSGRPGIPSLLLGESGSPRTWSVEGTGDPERWDAPAPTLLAALVGRPYRHSSPPPPVLTSWPSWL